MHDKKHLQPTKAGFMTLMAIKKNAFPMVFIDGLPLLPGLHEVTSRVFPLVLV
jgi:hypothetical protein